MHGKKSPDYKYVPYDIYKGRMSSRLTNNNLGASPPLTLGFHSSKRHAALIASCDQGSVVLAFTLVLLVRKRFLWRVVLVILMFVAWLLVDLSCFGCLLSTNIMLSLRDHVIILYWLLLHRVSRIKATPYFFYV